MLARYEAYADPLAKKAFLFAKIAERRGWLAVADPESWQVCADNVLMRLALRSGLVEPGGVDEVRADDPRRVRRRRRPSPASPRRSSTTCSGSSAARTPTCWARPPATCASRPALPAGTGTD